MPVQRSAIDASPFTLHYFTSNSFLLIQITKFNMKFDTNLLASILLTAHAASARACSVPSGAAERFSEASAALPAATSTGYPTSPEPSMTGQSGSESTGLPSAKGTAKGAVGAEEKPRVGAGPNGAQSWFITGLESEGGWQPPMLKMEDLVMISPDQFYKTFPDCARFRDTLSSSAKAKGVPEVLLLSIAMEESHCDGKARWSEGNKKKDLN
jgi:hypothetical protein